MMEEDWGAEANPYSTFRVQPQPPTSNVDRSSCFYDYVKVIHGREMSATVRSQLKGLQRKISNSGGRSPSGKQ